MTSGKPDKQRDMSHPSPMIDVRGNEQPIEKHVPVEWLSRPGFQAFGDRLNFLSVERQHLNTGKLRILPPSNPEKRNGRAS